jgi:hypothetical protein
MINLQKIKSPKVIYCKILFSTDKIVEMEDRLGVAGWKEG